MCKINEQRNAIAITHSLFKNFWIKIIQKIQDKILKALKASFNILLTVTKIWKNDFTVQMKDKSQEFGQKNRKNTRLRLTNCVNSKFEVRKIYTIISRKMQRL